MLTLVLSSVAHADWRTFEDVPEWAQRGNLRWVITGSSGRDLPAAQQLIDQGINLLWGSYGAADAGVRDFLVDHGVHRTNYICSTGLFWNPNDEVDLLKQYPPLKEGLVLRPDGGRLIIYDNPWDRDGATRRFAGCRIAPAWLEYQKRRMTLIAEGGEPFADDPVYHKMTSGPVEPLHAFFFDNAFSLECYCPHCQAAWREQCVEQFGIEVPDPRDYPDERVRAAWDEFFLDANAAYYRKLKEHAHAMDPPRLMAPNWVHGYPENFYLMERAEPDIVLVELGGGGERPWGRSEFSYKLALAATHGKAMANIWCFPAARPRLDLTRPTRPLLWTGDTRSTELTLAEGMASLGSYMTLGPPELNHFYAQYRDLYVNAQPASEVAIVYSVATEIWRRRVWDTQLHTFLGPHWWVGMDYTPAAHVKHLADRLSELGIPYDVLVESDLDPARLSQYRCLILPDVQCLSDKHAKALRAYVDSQPNGKPNSLLILGELGSRDEHGIRLPRKTVEQRLGDLSTTTRATILRPANFELTGYVADGWSGRIVAGPPTAAGHAATAEFVVRPDALPQGDGDYDLIVRSYDSSRGTGSLQLALNGQILKQWNLDRQSDDWRWLRIRNVALTDGDTMAVIGTVDKGELCYIQDVRIIKPIRTPTHHADTARTRIVIDPSPTPTIGTTELRHALSAINGLHLAWRTSRSTDDVYVNPLRPAGTNILALHLLNSSMQEQYHATILDHPECVAQHTIALDDVQLEAMNDPVVSLLGFTSYWSQTFMARQVDRQPYRADLAKLYPRLPDDQLPRHIDPDQLRLEITVNGEPAGQMLAQDIVEGWTHVKVDRKLLRVGQNQVELRVAGDTGFRRSYYGLLIDATNVDDASRWTAPPWPDHQSQSADDLSPFAGVQRGRFMMMLRDVKDDSLPTYQAKHAPAQDIVIDIPPMFGDDPVAVLLAPGDDAPSWLPVNKVDRPGPTDAPASDGGTSRLTGTGPIHQITVPRVDIYAVILLARDADELKSLLAPR
ncbi:MAG: hypothetical protein CMJ49_09990 [Planctomycetaceae bacterium]|nr:hypothetical protein [Planctomycetaceae bacterium]